MATVIKRGNTLHISYYDPGKRKSVIKSTGLEATEANRKKAEGIAKKFQEELTKKGKELKTIGIKKITIKDAFDHLLRNNERRNEKTKKDYLRFYSYFTKRFNENEPCTVITKLAIEEWLIEIKKLPLQQNSIHAIGKQLYHFLNFLFEYDYTRNFKINKEVRTKPEIKKKITLSPADTKIIFEKLEAKPPENEDSKNTDAASDNSKSKKKNKTKVPKEDMGKNSNFKTLIYLAYYTGLRSSDMLTIKAEDIDLNLRTISYYSPKRDVYRNIPFHVDLLPILKARVEEVKTGPILNYTNVENLGRAVTRYFKDIGLSSKKYTARTFRKTFITLARALGIDASIVRELVGHEHQTTADRYYNDIQMQTMKKELKKFKRADQITDESDIE
jgi:integrase